MYRDIHLGKEIKFYKPRTFLLSSPFFLANSVQTLSLPFLFDLSRNPEVLEYSKNKQGVEFTVGG